MIPLRWKIYALIALAFVAALLNWRTAGIQGKIDEMQAADDRLRVEGLKEAEEIEDDVQSDIYLADRASRWVRGHTDDE